MAFSKKDLREVEKLIRLARRGDAEAFGQAYDKLVVPIYRYIYYRVSSQDAEDLTETVFLKAWENRKRYKKQKGNSFASWLFRITHNVVVDHYRACAKNATAELSEDLPENNREVDPTNGIQRQFEQQELARAIRKLPEMQQQVVVLKFVNEFSNAKIAEIIGKSEGAMRIIQFRALAKLKKLLEEDGHPEHQRNKAAFLTFKTVQDA